ncbi:MAG: endonuclease domain-containing protein [Oscillospiraceae bacterium]|nr:endonuclease domain-containing protein [Oscillospiraceae bacterium]
MSLEYNQKLIPRAQELRRNMTPQEKRLWYGFLQRYPVRFQRQKTINQYIADFYCAKAGLVIEIDGAQHFEKPVAEYDQIRTNTLESMGLTVIRFTNQEVDVALAAVCEKIDEVAQKNLDFRQNPPQTRGESTRQRAGGRE